MGLLQENGGDDTYSIFLQNAETVALITPEKGSSGRTAIPVTSLKVGDEVLVRKQGGARHTGIEIQEFIVEK
jgi:3-dehydroquinate synthase class II